MNELENLKTSSGDATPKTLQTNKPNETREVFKAVFVGAPGTGKTTVLRKILRQCLASGRRALIVTPHENEWMDIPLVHPNYPERIRQYKGARRVICHLGSYDLLNTIRDNFVHGMLIFDDVKGYIRPSDRNYMEPFLLSLRQKDVDFACCGHGFTTIPPVFYAFATHFFVFKTTDNVHNRKNDVFNYELLERTVNRVNHNVSLSPVNAHYYEIIKNQ